MFHKVATGISRKCTKVATSRYVQSSCAPLWTSLRGECRQSVEVCSRELVVFLCEFLMLSTTIWGKHSLVSWSFEAGYGKRLEARLFLHGQETFIL